MTEKQKRIHDKTMQAVAAYDGWFKKTLGEAGDVRPADATHEAYYFGLAAFGAGGIYGHELAKKTALSTAKKVLIDNALKRSKP